MARQKEWQDATRQSEAIPVDEYARTVAGACASGTVGGMAAIGPAYASANPVDRSGAAPQPLRCVAAGGEAILGGGTDSHQTRSGKAGGAGAIRTARCRGAMAAPAHVSRPGR